jgi:xanthine dehydrogenase accessory factor
MRAFGRLGSAALVTLARVEGSSPREAGTRMVVRPSGGFHGTVGGGALEFAALEAANEALRKGRGPARRRSLALGPELGQCCGGRFEWRVETFDMRDFDDFGSGYRRRRGLSDPQRSVGA